MWSHKETAIYVRGCVQILQYNLADAYALTVPKDGRYGVATHTALKQALLAASSENGVRAKFGKSRRELAGATEPMPPTGLSAEMDTRPVVAVMDDQGPAAMASWLFPSALTDFDGRLIACAWGWWASKLTPRPSMAYAQIEETNKVLSDAGDEPLTILDAVEFADVPGAKPSSRWPLILGSAVGMGLAGVIGWQAGKSRCPVAGSARVRIPRR